MGYTVKWNQCSQNELCPEFLQDVRTACEKYTAETGEQLETLIEPGVVIVNSLTNGCEDVVINNVGQGGQFCKTNELPYDLIVKTILLIARKYDYIYNLRCDGKNNCDNEDFEPAKNFVKKYGLLVFN